MSYQHYTFSDRSFKTAGLKIFYAVQATGNGHIARAVELLPYLEQYGTVDIFLSGSNSDLHIDLPVKYRSRGLSLFYHKNGGLDYWKMFKELNLPAIYKHAKQLPVEKYDIVINDFESITSLACRLKKIPSINFGHQASFQSDKTPRPSKKDFSGELILKKYATASHYTGLHFEAYDDFIFNPVIKNDILKASPGDKGYVTVYLSHYADEKVAVQLHKIKDLRFEVFSKKVKQVTIDRNITFIPISNKMFNESMINCSGIITGAGFETPAEALYMQKKLLCLPIKGQYEQLCNAEALKRFNVPIIKSIDEHFHTHVYEWLRSPYPKHLKLNYTTDKIIEQLMKIAEEIKIKKPDLQYHVATIQ